GLSFQSPFLSSLVWPPTQVPPWHESTRVHCVPSLQLVPFGRLLVTHPSAMSQVVTLQTFVVERHVTGVFTEQEPLPLQESPLVHAFESLQAVPAGFGGFVQ